MMDLVARAVGVTRRFGATTALHGVDLDVPAGASIGLLGPNGAGKSTLMSLLVGLRAPDAGHVELFGGSPRDATRRMRLGVTPQETGLPATLRVVEVLRFVGRHYPDPLPPAEVLERFGLAGLEQRQCGGLSGGQRRRLAVALAFVGRPRLVVLDEPTTGLDVEARHALWAAVRSFHADGGAVLLTSHYLEEVEQLAERVVVLAAGRVIADADVARVRGLVAAVRVEVRSPGLPELPGVQRVEREGDRYVLHTTDADRLVRSLVQSGAVWSDLQVRAATLEEAFLTLTAADGKAAR
jgi:ABC-2 type transport system ATP-binding protein